MKQFAGDFLEMNRLLNLSPEVISAFRDQIYLWAMLDLEPGRNLDLDPVI